MLWQQPKRAELGKEREAPLQVCCNTRLHLFMHAEQQCLGARIHTQWHVQSLNRHLPILHGMQARHQQTHASSGLSLILLLASRVAGVVLSAAAKCDTPNVKGVPPSHRSAARPSTGEPKRQVSGQRAAKADQSGRLQRTASADVGAGPPAAEAASTVSRQTSAPPAALEAAAVQVLAAHHLETFHVTMQCMHPFSTLPDNAVKDHIKLIYFGCFAMVCFTQLVPVV